MRKAYLDICKKEKIVIWGAGQLFETSFNKIDPDLNIIAVCDSDEKKWGKTYTAKLIPCISKDLIEDDAVVIIAIKSKAGENEVVAELVKREIDYCFISDAVEEYRIKEEEREAERFFKIYPKESIKCDNIIKKYVLCNIPYNNCNLRCHYCYVNQTMGYSNKTFKRHSPKYIRAALSRKRLGGTAIITLCGKGETLLYEDLPEITKELVAEGHYVTIVTNGTITSTFKKIGESEIDFSYLFIKFSLHYLELKRLGLLEEYVKNVHYMRKLGASVTIELVASDDLIEYIDEIKEWSMESFGALPHLTIPRDDTAKSFKILTDLEYDDYVEVWKQFESVMFDFKVKTIGMKRFEDCMAGEWSFITNIDTGDIFKCTRNPYVSNLYEDIFEPIKLEKVGKNCCLPYCYNCHAYMALGLIEGFEAPTYYETRERTTPNGEHWVTDKVKEIFSQKLYINNAKEMIEGDL